MQFDIKTLTKINEYYLGFESGFKMYLAIKPIATIKIQLEIEETNEAPTCIKLAYKIVFDNEPHGYL